MPAATATLPSLSEVAAWDTGHLTTAASQWDNKAASWEGAFTELLQQVASPGGTEWSGTAAEAALARAHSDRSTVLAVADQFHSAAATARFGAVKLDAAKQRVLDAVSRARAVGFTVGQDFSVTYPRHVSSTAEAAARQVQAATFSAQILSRAATLAALDHDVAARISASAMDGKLNFKEDPGADAFSVKDAKDVHRIVDPLPPGKNPGVKTLPTPEAIRRLYEHLTQSAGPPPPSTYRGERRMLEDGTIVGYRPTSGWGGPTVDIRYPDGSEVGVHLPDRPDTSQPAPVTTPTPTPIAPPVQMPTPAPNPIAVPPAPGPNPASSSPAPPVSPDEGALATIGAGALWVLAGIGAAAAAVLGG